MQTATPNPQLSRAWAGLLFFAGVILPSLSFGIELVTGLCASALFNPMPTLLHVALVGLLPLANFLALQSLRALQPRYLGVMTALNGAAMAIAFFYSILFAPITPIAIIGVIAFGIGLLPLAPLLGFIAAWRLRILLKRRSQQQGSQFRFWPGFALALLLLIGVDLPATTTRLGLEMANASTPGVRENAIHLLRLAGSEQTMLQHCYSQSRGSTDLIGALFIWSNPVSPETAQTIFYRVTGKPYTSLPRPVAPDMRRSWRNFGRFDGHQGGAVVGEQLEGLHLSSSRFDGSFDANAALAYLEWTMVFKNDTHLQREARAQIALPPGAVVSRLSLWVDGEEREAAFAGTRDVRAAYQKVVQRQRDPVLVTHAGQDRIMMQLFPVPPQGEMKVRLGITLPAQLPSLQEAQWRMPFFHERNFDFPAGFTHSVWVDAKAPLHSDAQAAVATSGGFSFRAQWDDARLASPAALFVAARTSATEMWAPDSKARGFLFRQSFVSSMATVPKHLIVVLDASASMRDFAAGIADVLRQLPPTTSISLIVADSDSAAEAPQAEGLTPAMLGERILHFRFNGGHDNVPALRLGMQMASAQRGSVLLWLHGSQPVALSSPDVLLQIAEREVVRPSWIDVQVVPGANKILQAVDGRLASQTLAIGDLNGLVQRWANGQADVLRQVERVSAMHGEFNLLSEKTSDHLGRLWANAEIHRLIALSGQRAEAVRLAQRYQLVTPVSGAVVLETQAQYDEAGLEPVKAGTVPTIPEPETWMLIGVALAALGAWKKHRQVKNAPA